MRVLVLLFAAVVLYAQTSQLPPSGGSSISACATNPPVTGTAGQVCVIGTSQYLCHTTGACSVAGDWTLVGPVPIPLTLSLPALGTTPTDALTLPNPTAAAAGAQQYSPALEQIGQGWVLLTAPTAPTSNAPTSGGACDNGTHYWLVTYINATGETTMGAASAVQTCATSGNLQTEGLTAIPTGPSGTTGRNVYRSKAGAAHAIYTDFFLDCASSPCIANNTATTFSDALADASLGANPPAANGTGNSQSVGFRSYVVPVQGTTTGASYWGLFYHPPSGGDVLGLSMLPNGNVNVSGGITSNYIGYGFNGFSGANQGMTDSGATLIFTTSSGGVINFENSASGSPVLQLIVSNTTGNHALIPVAPTATPNYATLSIGSGAWDGVTTGKFVGSSSGTSIGVNEVSGYAGDLFNVQVAGVSQAKISAAGLLTLAGSTFLLGGHTCSIVATVLTCP